MSKELSQVHVASSATVNPSAFSLMSRLIILVFMIITLMNCFVMGSSGYYISTLVGKTFADGEAIPFNLASITPSCLFASSSDLYICETSKQVIMKANFLTSNLETVVGGGTESGVNIPSSKIQLNNPRSIFINEKNEILIAEPDVGIIRKADNSGVCTILAGSLTSKISAFGGLANETKLYNTKCVCGDKKGNVYICADQRILKVADNGIISALAGSTQGFSGDGGLAVNAKFNTPVSCAVSDEGNVYIADQGNKRIRVVDAGGNISTIAGTSNHKNQYEGITSLNAYFNQISNIYIYNGEVYVVDNFGNNIRRISKEGNVYTVPTGSLNYPSGVAFLFGDMFVIDSMDFAQGRLLQVSQGVTKELVKSSNGDGQVSTYAKVSSPYAIFSTSTDLYFSEANSYRLRKIAYNNKTISTIAGTGIFSSYSGNGGLAVDAGIGSVQGIFVTSNNTIYFSDTSNHCIRKINVDGKIELVAGEPGVSGFSGEGGLAISAKMNSPEGIFLFNEEIYFADTGNHVIRKIDKHLIISTIAGTSQEGFSDGTNGDPLTAKLSSPRGLYIHPNGTIYFADTSNNRIRKILNGKIETIAGTGENSYDNTPKNTAIESALNEEKKPTGIYMYNDEIYFTDYRNSLVRKITAEGKIVNIAGMPYYFSFTGENVVVLEDNTGFFYIMGITGNSRGEIFIADSFNNKVRMLSPYDSSKDYTCSGLLYYDPTSCSGLGKCVSADTCQCISGYAGENCQYPVCFGKLSNSSSSCSNHGSCKAPNSCLCRKGYFGSECDLIGCYGISSLENNSCNGNGKCVDTDTCQCFRDWKGSNCSVYSPYCFDINAANVTVCSGKGFCVSSDKCNCSKGYSGEKCDDFYCNTIHRNDTTVCSQRGTCIGSDKCSCNNGYGGENCELYNCFGHVQTDPQVCSSNGTCVDINVCKCKRGFYGENCQIVHWNETEDNDFCFGTRNNDTNVCSGNGLCSSKDFCLCNVGYAGNMCQYTICDGFYSNDPYACYGNGNCTSYNLCTCNQMYEGRYCQFEKIDIDAKYMNMSYVALPISGYDAFGDGINAKSAYISLTTFHITSGGVMYVADGLNEIVRKVDLKTNLIYTLAGQVKTKGFTNGPSFSSLFDYVYSIFVTDDEIIYVVDRFNNAVRKIDPKTNNVTTIAGTGEEKISNDNIQASKASLFSPMSVRVNSNGEIFVSEFHRIRKIGTNGVITTIAGSGTSGFSGDGGLATSCALNAPNSFFLNTDGSILIADTSNRRIRKIKNGYISTIAGNGQNTDSGSSNPLATGFNDPSDVFQNSNGEIYIADKWNNKIKKISADLTTITTVAGNGQQGWSGDNVAATNTKLYGPNTVFFFDSELYIGDSANNRIRKVSKDGKINTIAGSGSFGLSTDNIVATSSQMNEPTTMILKGDDLVVADSNNRRIRQISAATGIISTIIGNGAINSYVCSDNSSPLQCSIAYPTALSLTPQNDIIFTDNNYHYLLKFTNSSNTVSTIAGKKGYGGFEGDNGLATAAKVNGITSTVVASNGDIFISDSNNHRIRKISNQKIYTVAGTGTTGSLGDGKSATSAQLNSPAGLFIAPSGELYIADQKNHKVRKINKNGNIETVIGSGVDGCSPEGVEPLSCDLSNPKHMLLIGSELFVLDSGNNRVIKFDTVAKTNISIVMGKNQDSVAYRTLNNPNYMVYNSGQLIISDTGNHMIISLQPVCFGVESRNSMVCYGHGKCQSSNNCSCDLNYYGSNCSLYNCYGTVFSDEHVCNGNGRCIAPNSCKCKLGWTGPYCNVSIPTHQCFGIFNFDSNVCSGKGKCMSQNYCNCTNGYGGEACQYNICGGILSNNASVCSSQGTCTSPDKCACSNGYLGDACQYYNCYGQPSNSPTICNGRGSCVAPWTCDCKNGYDGPSCELALCWGYTDWQQSLVCSGLGSCVEINTCSCKLGYYGEKCNVPMCNGMLANSSSVCSGVGTCPSFDVCTCPPPYYGNNCQYKEGRYRMQYSVNSIAGYDPESSPLDSSLTFVTPYGIHATEDHLYVSSEYSVRQVDLKTKQVTIIAGSLVDKYNDKKGPFDNVPALSSSLRTPDGVSIFNNALYFVDWNVHRALKVDLASGNISTVAGNGASGYSWNEPNVATQASLNVPEDIVVAPNGYIFIADTSNNRIRVVINETIRTICGSYSGFSGDGAPAKDAKVSSPQGLFLTKEGDLLFSDLGNERIRKIANVLTQLGEGIITTVAGNGKKDWTGDGGSALEASFNYPSSVVADDYGNMYICDYYNNLIRKVSNTTGNVSTIAGARVKGIWGGKFVPVGSFDGDEPKPSVNSTLQFPMRLAINSQYLFISDTNNKRVRKIGLQTGIISTLVGYGNKNFNGDRKIANETILGEVRGLQYHNGEIYFSDRTLHVIRKIASNGTIQTIAGSQGISGNSGDNGLALQSKLNNPQGIYITSKGEIYVADSINYVIRKIGTDGIIKTVIGSGTRGYSVDGMYALESDIQYPTSIGMLTTGELVFSDLERIRKLGKDGKLYTIAGSSQIFKDGVNATESAVQLRSSLVISPNNEIYFVCEKSGIRVRKISKEGLITTIVGNGKNDAYGPENVLANKYPVANIMGITLTKKGEIIVVEGSKIRRLTASGFIYTIAGSSESDYNGDFKRGTFAGLSYVYGISSYEDKIYFADSFGDIGSNLLSRIRELNPYIPICYQKFANDSSVCFGRGDCLSENSCTCDSPYYGNECSEFDCYGIWRNNSNVCSQNGTCISPNNCKCDSLYTGSRCEIPICYGINATSSHVCSYGNGTCVKGNTCICNSNYTGFNCQFPICYGRSSNDTNVCEGHGTCYSPNNCICKEGYTGNDCQYPICFNKTSFEHDVCSGNGTCIMPNTCKCDTEYFGLECQVTRCHGVFSNKTETCSENGICTSPNNCVCNSNYTGYDCQFPICYGLSANDTNVCSTTGDCILPNQCKCDIDYYGDYCNITTCYGHFSNEVGLVCSGNGTCISPSKCVCMEGFTGLNCELKICNNTISNNSNVCSSNGKCTKPNVCDCNNGYYGEWCELFKCFSVPFDSNETCSGQGSCLSLDNCTCNLDYFGQDCNVTTCSGMFSTNSKVCSGVGSCVRPNTCQCKEGYSGHDCELYYCNSKQYNETNVCSGNGICQSPENCLCNQGYTGDFCQYITCGGILSNDTNVCSGRGVCVSPNSCNCHANNNTKVFGQACEKLQCLGEGGSYYSSNSTKVCNGRGKCVVDGCECNTGYLGEYCQIEKCFGIPSYDSGVCSGRGKCTALDTCICIENDQDGYWGGSMCNDCLPSRSGSKCLEKFCNESTTCSGHGKCNDTTLDCDCSGGWDGRFCSSCKKNMYGESCDIFCESSSTCSSHGSCGSSDGSCICHNDNLNGYWTSSNCSTCQHDVYGEQCSTKFTGPAQFTDLGNGVTVHVFGPSSYTRVNIDCSILLKSEESLLYGENPVCMWINKNNGLFLIQFGEQYQLRPGMNISLNRLVFDTHTNNSDFEVMPVLNANNPVKPVALISNIRDTIGLCDEIEIDGSKSYSGDRKALIFNWEWIQVPDAELKDLFNSSDSNKNSSIIIPSTCAEGKYTISLLVQSSLSGAESERVAFTFTKSGLPLPIISIVGKNEVIIKSTDIPYVIKPEISLPSCFYENKNVTITWKQTSGPQLITETDILGNLIISGFTLKLATQYDFEAQAKSIENPNSKAFAKSSISVIFGDLFLNTYLSNIDVDKAVVNAEFEDPDDSDESEVWIWTCLEQYTSDYCDQSIDDQLAIFSSHRNTSFELIAGELKNIILTLKVQKGARTKTSDLTISFPKNSLHIPPLISMLDFNPRSVYIVRGDTFSLQVSVSIGGIEDGIDIQRQWLLNSQPIPSPVISLMSEDPSMSNSIVLDTTTLDEGSSYELYLNVTSSESHLSASFSKSFKIARSPQSCECSVTPLTGYVLDTDFKFACTNCQNQEKTIDFIYGYMDEKSNSQVPLYILGEAFPTRLPPPADAQSDQMTTFIKIIDTSTGASCTKYQSVTILYPKITTIPDLTKKVDEWNLILNQQLANFNPSKIAVNSVSISKAVDVMFNRILSNTVRKRSLQFENTCLNGGSFDALSQKCLCTSGFTKEDCSMSILDQANINQMRQTIVSNYQTSLKLRNTAELLSENYLKTLLVGLLPVIEAYDEIDSNLFNNICSILELTLKMAQSNKNLKLVTVENILKSYFNFMDKYSKYNSLEQNKQVIVMSLINEYSLMVIRNKDVGQPPYTIETNSLSLLTGKNYMDQLSSRTFTEMDARVKTPSLMSRFLKPYPKRKPLTYMMKIHNYYTPPTQSSTTRRSVMSKAAVEYSIQEVKLNGMSDFIRYELPLLYFPANSSYLTTEPSEILVEQTMEGTSKKSVYRREFLSCSSLSSENQWIDSSDCIFEYDINRLPNYGICKCSKQASVVIVLNKEDRVEMEVVPPKDQSSQLDYLGFLALIALPLIAIVVGVVVAIVIKRKKKQAAAPPSPPMNIELGIV